MKTNKTKVINNMLKWITVEDKTTKEYKEVKQLRIKIRKTDVKDIERIEHFYNNILELYYLSSKQVDGFKDGYRIYLSGCIKYILESDLKLDFHSIEEIKSWYNLGIL